MNSEHPRVRTARIWRNKLPAAFRACLSDHPMDRDSYWVLPARREALKALLMMAGADYVTATTTHTESYWKSHAANGSVFIADQDRLDPQALMEFLEL